MTASPEAKLAREAEMCYATLAWITDYDVWRANTEEVSVEAVVQNLLKNVATSKEMLKRLMPALSGDRDCSCGTSLKDAIITAPERIPADLKKKLSPIIGKYAS
jgi:5'-methylthioadenosine phosphorylase